MNQFHKGLHWGMGYHLVTKRRITEIECPFCMETIDIYDKFCPYCGEKIPKCLKCGRIMDQKWKYCPNCGTKLEVEP